MEVEEAEWLTPSRRKTLAPGKLVSPETSDVSENPFTPLARLNPGGCNTEKSTKAERPPPIFIKKICQI
jgi:hypothetical protein